MSDKVSLLNARVDNITMDELLDSLKEGTLLTLHVDMIVKLQQHRDFYEISKKFDVVTCDSQILYFASKILGHPLKERVSGSDFFPKFYMKNKDNPEVTIFLCGAMAGIAEVAQRKINAKVGRDIVVGTYSPPIGFEKDDAECERILKAINDSKASVLLVGLGAPKQERFIFKYRDRLPHVKLYLPLGGTIDYEAGDLERPAAWITTAGLEWLYRLASEPRKRWRRYLVHQVPVLYLLAQQKLGMYKNPFGRDSQGAN